jgi:hypothetical protein
MTGIPLPSLRNASLTRRFSFARRCRALLLDGPQLQVDGRCQTGNNPRGATCPRKRRRSTGPRCRGSRLRYRGWAADPTRPGLDHSYCPNCGRVLRFCWDWRERSKGHIPRRRAAVSALFSRASLQKCISQRRKKDACHSGAKRRRTPQSQSLRYR